MLLAAVVITVKTETTAKLIGIVIPILVALVTKASASSGMKAVINALMSAVAGALAVVVQQHGDVWNLNTLGASIGWTWVVSIATYYGLLKPAGIAPAVARVTARAGIG